MTGVAFLKRLEAMGSSEQSSQSFRQTAVGLHAIQLYESVRNGAFEDQKEAKPLREFAETLAVHAQDTHTHRELWTALQGIAATLPFWGSRGNWGVGREAVYAALLQYATELSNADEWELAVEILLIVAIDAEVDGENAWAAQAQLLLGFAYRTLADWDNSARSYRQAYTLARQAGVFSVALRACIGEANNKRTRGDLPGAARQLAGTLRRAYATCPEIVPRVMLSQANVANAGGHAEEAVSIAYRALKLAGNDRDAQYPILVDIAQFLADYGVRDVALETLQLVADTAPEALVRVHALINLLYLSASRQDEAAFESVRGRLGHENPRPRQETLSHLFQAQGYLRFGRVPAAREAANRAASLARQHAFYQYSFQAEDEIRKIDQASAVSPDDSRHPVQTDDLRTGRAIPHRVARIAGLVRDLVAIERDCVRVAAT
jgi:tetratricopeptide (TPR) repeat protein